MKAGFGKVCISPAPGSPLTGFAARNGTAEGIHDHLYARTLVLENELHALCLISVEVLALAETFVQQVRDRVAASTGIKASAILIAATHTHAGPVTIRTFFNPQDVLDEVYMLQLADAITSSAESAWQSRFPARVGIGSAQVDGIAANRRNPDRLPIDSEAGIIKITDAAGATRGVVINYACHLTVLGPDNLLVTGDMAAPALEYVEKSIGAGGFAMFLNGAEGDVNVGHSATLGAVGVIAPGRTFERARQLGEKLGHAVIQQVTSIGSHSDVPLSSASTRFELPLKRYPELTETAAAILAAQNRLEQLTTDGVGESDIQQAQLAVLYTIIDDANAKAVAGGVHDVELQVMRIGDATFAAIPGEPFVEIALRFKSLTPRPAFIIGLANGYIGYIPTSAAYADGGYEVASTLCAPGCDVNLTAALKQLDRIAAEDDPVD